MRPSYVAAGAASRRGSAIASFTPVGRPHGRRGSAGILRPFGAWRSLVAHPAGGRAVGGSNPLAPTTSRGNGYGETVARCDSLCDSRAGGVVVRSGQRVHAGVVRDYLRLITFDSEGWPSKLLL